MKALLEWSRSATRLVDNQLQAVGLSIPKDAKENLVINLPSVDIFRGPFQLSLPDHALKLASELCVETLTPVYNTLAGNIDRITELLLELESSCDSEERTSCRESESYRTTTGAEVDMGLVDPKMARCPQGSMQRDQLYESKGRRSMYPPPAPIVIPSTHPLAPSIVIHPCGTQNQERTCRVPCQNSAFGKMLTVPSHAPFNAVHPPMLLPSAPSTSLPVLEEWAWKDGHWEVVLPCLRQQTRRGLFSKMQSARRRTHRPSANEH